MDKRNIAKLMSGLDLNPAQQQKKYTPAPGESNADGIIHQEMRYLDRLRPQKAGPPTLPIQQSCRQNIYTQRDGRALAIKKTAKMPKEPPPSKANFGSQPNTRDERASDESSAADSSLAKTQPSHIYIVQIMHPSENIEGVFSSLVDANTRALDYLKNKHGIKACEVSGKRGLFGQATSIAKATKRIWGQTGTLEILTLGGASWIRVLKKTLHARRVTTAEKTVFLSLDRSNGIFVIGAYQSKDEARQDRKKYWSNLAVSASMMEYSEWDEEGFPYARATIAGKLHHWSLKHYELM